MWSYRVEVTQSWVESKEVRKNGKPKLIRVIHRRLFLDRAGDGFGPGRFRVVLVRRGGCDRYSVSVMPAPVKELWPTLKLAPDPKPDWKRIESMEEATFIKWLGWMLGARTLEAKDRLESEEPIARAA